MKRGSLESEFRGLSIRIVKAFRIDLRLIECANVEPQNEMGNATAQARRINLITRSSVSLLPSRPIFYRGLGSPGPSSPVRFAQNKR